MRWQSIRQLNCIWFVSVSSYRTGHTICVIKRKPLQSHHISFACLTVVNRKVLYPSSIRKDLCYYVMWTVYTSLIGFFSIYYASSSSLKETPIIQSLSNSTLSSRLDKLSFLSQWEFIHSPAERILIAHKSVYPQRPSYIAPLSFSSSLPQYHIKRIISTHKYLSISSKKDKEN